MIAEYTATEQKKKRGGGGGSVKEGPLVKELDSALQSIGVHCQQYLEMPSLVTMYIGNHVRW